LLGSAEKYSRKLVLLTGCRMQRKKSNEELRLRSSDSAPWRKITILHQDNTAELNISQKYQENTVIQNTKQLIK
jgi:hypothetical protein